MARSIAFYGWRPDVPDHRDFKYGAVLRSSETVELVPNVDLESSMPSIQDQGQGGTCTGHAVVGVIGHNIITQRKPFEWPSRLFPYYNGRAIEGSADSDSGAMLRDVISGLADNGICPESLWPYDLNNVTLKPTDDCYQAALANRIKIYARLHDLDDMLMCLAAGFPFVFGFTVYDAFESDAVAQTGILSMPAQDEGAVGGHAVVAVGYDLQTKRIKVRNSWGTDWGQKGYFTIPFDYIGNRDLADDFWTIRF